MHACTRSQAPFGLPQARWAPELVSIVAKINENFGSNFRDIACAGEVTLGMVGAADDGAPNFDDPALDYEKVAIHIRVKFRDSEPMQLLTPLRQSGGERALTTMLYLIAIQVRGRLHGAGRPDTCMRL